MKLISWNVNGLRAVMSKDTLLPFIAAEDPDIMAFQETKMQEEQMEFNFDGYLRYMNSAEKKGYSGTMVGSSTWNTRISSLSVPMCQTPRMA